MISERFLSVIFKELKIEAVPVEDDTKAYQVPGWDSLSHANVITALERDFKIKLKPFEVMRCKNIGDLQRLVDSKIST